MPFRFPFNFPFNYNRKYYYNNKAPSNFENIYNKSPNRPSNVQTSKTDSQFNNKSTENFIPNNTKKAIENSELSVASFEILGIKLYLDDILILCLLFFLYTENVKDDELFICLILLLLT